jgi:hypothetical protein
LGRRDFGRIDFAQTDKFVLDLVLRLAESEDLLKNISMVFAVQAFMVAGFRGRGASQKRRGEVVGA